MLILKIFLLLTIVKRSQAFELRSPYAAHFYPKTPLDHRYPTFNRLADQSDQLNFGFPPSIQPPPNFAVDSHQQAFANAASVVPIAPTFPSFVQPVPNSYGAVPVSNGYGPAPYVPVQNGYGGAPSGYQSGGLGPLCPPVTVTATTQSSYGYYQSNSGYGGSSQSGSGQQESSKPLEYGESAYFPILPPVDLSRCFTRYTETRLVGSIPFLQNKTQGMEECLVMCLSAWESYQQVCESVVFLPRDNQCQLYNHTGRWPPGGFYMQYGYDYYEPTNCPGCSVDVPYGVTITEPPIFAPNTTTSPSGYGGYGGYGNSYNNNLVANSSALNQANSTAIGPTLSPNTTASVPSATSEESLTTVTTELTTTIANSSPNQEVTEGITETTIFIANSGGIEEGKSTTLFNNVIITDSTTTTEFTTSSLNSESPSSTEVISSTDTTTTGIVTQETTGEIIAAETTTTTQLELSSTSETSLETTAATTTAAITTAATTTAATTTAATTTITDKTITPEETTVQTEVIPTATVFKVATAEITETTIGAKTAETIDTTTTTNNDLLETTSATTISTSEITTTETTEVVTEATVVSDETTSTSTLITDKPTTESTTISSTRTKTTDSTFSPEDTPGKPTLITTTLKSKVTTTAPLTATTGKLNILEPGALPPPGSDCTLDGKMAVMEKAIGYKLDSRNGFQLNSIEETDCYNRCLVNSESQGAKRYCLSASYNLKTKVCTIYSDVAARPVREDVSLINDPDSIYFEKVCLGGVSTAKCQVGSIDRVPGIQMMSENTKTAVEATSAIDCILQCLGSSTPCKSASYMYTKKSLNCLLSDKTRTSNPTDVDSSDKAVEYYGFDTCDGKQKLQRFTASKAKNVRTSLLKRLTDLTLSKQANEVLKPLASQKPKSVDKVKDFWLPRLNWHR